MDRNLALEVVRVTEATALAASRIMGCGDERMVDEAAIAAMHKALSGLDITGLVALGDDDTDRTPVLYRGQTVGNGKGPRVDLAVAPLEGSTVCAKGGQNACTVVAITEKGGFLSVPSTYMDKIAIGPGWPKDIIDLTASPAQNLKALAKAKKADVADLLICMLDRPRHEELIAKVRETGARIMLIGDGDVSGVIATALPHSGVDMYLGNGGAAEGVLAGAGLRCFGGQMQGRLICRGGSEKAEAKALGIKDPSKVFTADDMASGNVMFAATGVSDGPMLRGVRRWKGGAITHSMVMRSKTATVRYIEAHHNFTHKAQ